MNFDWRSIVEGIGIISIIYVAWRQERRICKLEEEIDQKEDKINLS